MSDDQLQLLNYRNVLSLKNRLGRALWGISYWLLFRPFIGRVFNPWRCFVLRCFGAKLKGDVTVFADARIWAPWNLEMTDSLIGPAVNVYNTGLLVIGRLSIISHGAYICTGSHDIEDPAFPMIPSTIRIEDQVWVATEAFIGPRVTLGQGAVVGARACVFKDVEPWTVVGGNPAKVLKRRVVRVV